MPPEDSSQLPLTGSSTETPGAAAMAGPDSMKLPPSPLAGVGTQAQQQRDWEASYKGLMTRYNEDRTAWDADRKSLAEGYKTLEAKLAQIEQRLGAPTPPAAKPQGAQPQEGPVDDRSAELYDRLSEMEARQRRDNLLFQYMQPGQPGYGINLWAFRDNVPVIVDEDDQQAEKDQRTAIENFVTGLKNIAGSAQVQTQQAMLSGFTPGTSPGAPPQTMTKDQLIARYYEVKALYSSPDVDKMTPEQQAQIQAEYYDLHNKVGQYLPGQSRPWMNAAEMMDAFNQLQGRVGQFEQMMATRK